MEILIRILSGLIFIIIIALAMLSSSYIIISIAIFIQEYKWKSLIVPVIVYIAYLLGGVVWK